MFFPRNGSQYTPSHKSIDFDWKDYCPMVFRLNMFSSSMYQKNALESTETVALKVSINTPTVFKITTCSSDYLLCMS